MEADGCQRTLALSARPEPGAVSVAARAYDDRGRSVPAAGAGISAGAVAATADPAGNARLALPAGRHELRASAPGLVPAFPVEVRVP
jgi:hypothetical protein